ncbi:hypothetical protein, partial [Dysosmobacter sp.]|uniref:hypothetical protein n=1 Tax=Dysosmobacter sp. TaxID=2591382 RepID=UPI003AB628A9
MNTIHGDILLGGSGEPQYSRRNVRRWRRFRRGKFHYTVLSFGINVRKRKKVLLVMEFFVLKSVSP